MSEAKFGEPWEPTIADMPSDIPSDEEEWRRVTKRIQLQRVGFVGDWFMACGKSQDCKTEGQANHWFWLAYWLLGLVKTEDCPYALSKPLPFHKNRVVESVEALAGIVDPATFVADAVEFLQKIRSRDGDGAIEAREILARHNLTEGTVGK